MDNDNRSLWMTIRRALIMILGAIEDRLGVERSIMPRPERVKGFIASDKLGRND